MPKRMQLVNSCAIQRQLKSWDEIVHTQAEILFRQEELDQCFVLDKDDLNQSKLPPPQKFPKHSAKDIRENFGHRCHTIDTEFLRDYKRFYRGHMGQMISNDEYARWKSSPEETRDLSSCGNIEESREPSSCGNSDMYIQAEVNFIF
jgi:hypothetical protein